MESDQKGPKKHYANETQSFKKVTNYLIFLTEDREFMYWVKEIRKDFDIPEEGFKSNAKSTLDDFPKEWSGAKDEKMVIILNDMAERLCVMVSLDPYNFRTCFRYFIFYGVMSIDSKYQYDLIRVQPDKGYGSVILEISQYATKRDILDYISLSYKTVIEPIQKKYRDKDIKIGKIRDKDPKVQERNDFIFNNRRISDKKFRSYRDLAKMVQEKFGGPLLDYAYIGKIINTERKIRKEV